MKIFMDEALSLFPRVDIVFRLQSDILCYMVMFRTECVYSLLSIIGALVISRTYVLVW